MVSRRVVLPLICLTILYICLPGSCSGGVIILLLVRGLPQLFAGPDGRGPGEGFLVLHERMDRLFNLPSRISSRISDSIFHIDTKTKKKGNWKKLDK